MGGQIKGKEILYISSNDETSSVVLPSVSSPRTCRVRGVVGYRDRYSDEIKILLDSGASYSVLSKTFFNRNFPDISLTKSCRRGAQDASGNQISLLGDCFLDLVISSPDKTLEIKNLRFTVLESLSVECIIGCEALSCLNFKLNENSATLNGVIIPRILAIKEIDLPVMHEISVCKAIQVDYITHIRLVLELDFSKINNLKPNSFYKIHFLDDFSSDGAISAEIPARYTSTMFVPTNDRGELEATSNFVSFNGSVDRTPNTVRALFIGVTDDNQSCPKSHVNILGNKQPKLTDESVDKMLKGSVLNKTLMGQLLRSNKQVFALNDMDLGCYKEEVEIKLRDPTINPKYSKPLTYPYNKLKDIDEHVRRMLEHDLIRVSSGSPFNSPCHLIPKGGKSKVKSKNNSEDDKTNGNSEFSKSRFIINYTYVNSLIKQNRWPIPSVRRVLESLSGAKIFSTLDLKSGFFQIRLTENSREITAFSLLNHQYELNQLPQGLSTSPGIFQSIMVKIFNEHLYKGVIAFVDDILVYSSSAEEHIKLLKMVFNKLKLAGLKLSPDKCSFGLKKAEYLGYMVSENGYEPLRDRLQALSEMSSPTDKTSLKSFIGSVNFYSTNLPELQRILDPLHKISGTTSKFVWGQRQQEAYEKAKEIMGGSGTLDFPNEQGELILTTDASQSGYGGCLSQILKDGTEKPIRYFSGTFKGSEMNWIIREKELYSFYFGVQFCWDLLMCRPFTWRSDNKSLSTLTDSTLKMKASGCKNYRLLRWLDYLNNFDFNTELRKGTSPEMGLADCLSRLNQNETDSDKMRIALLQLPFWAQQGIALVEFVEAQKSDIDLIERKGVWSKLAKRSKFRIQDGVHEIFVKKIGWLPMCPAQLVQNVLNFYHLPAHTPMRRMYNEIRTKMYVPRLYQHITENFRSCVKCVAINPVPKTKSKSIKTTTPVHPWSWASVDLVGPLDTSLDGNNYILTYVDHFTKWIEIRPIPSKSAEDVLKALDSILSVRGPPLNILGDNGREFQNHLLQNYLQDLGIKWCKICPYHPQSNGLCERSNGKIKRALRFRGNKLTWDKDLPSIQLEINLQRQNDGLSPFQRLHGWLLHRPAYLSYESDPLTYEQYVKTQNAWTQSMIQRMSRAISDKFGIEELEKMSQSDQKSSDTTENDFKINDIVLVFFPDSGTKIFSPWKGTYKVTEIVDKNTFVVSMIGNSRKKFFCHRKRLRLLNKYDETTETVTMSHKGLKKLRPVDSSDGHEQEGHLADSEKHLSQTTDNSVLKSRCPLISKEQVRKSHSQTEISSAPMSRYSLTSKNEPFSQTGNPAASGITKDESVGPDEKQARSSLSKNSESPSRRKAFTDALRKIQVTHTS